MGYRIYDSVTWFQIEIEFLGFTFYESPSIEYGSVDSVPKDSTALTNPTIYFLGFTISAIPFLRLCCLDSLNRVLF